MDAVRDLVTSDLKKLKLARGEREYQGCATGATRCAKPKFVASEQRQTRVVTQLQAEIYCQMQINADLALEVDGHGTHSWHHCLPLYEQGF